MVLTSPWGYNFNCAPHGSQYFQTMYQQSYEKKGCTHTVILITEIILFVIVLNWQNRVATITTPSHNYTVTCTCNTSWVPGKIAQWSTL